MISIRIICSQHSTGSRTIINIDKIFNFLKGIIQGVYSNGLLVCFFGFSDGDYHTARSVFGDKFISNKNSNGNFMSF